MSETSLALRKQLEQSLESSIDKLAREHEVVMLLLDTSGSMAGEPIRQLRKVVDVIKAEGHVPMIAFGGPYDAQVRFVDVIPEPDGGTPLHIAIPFAKEYGATRLVVISDGMPDLAEQCLIEADKFGGKIDVMFIGSEGDMGSKFLEELAKRTGGIRREGSLKDPNQLAGQVILMLEGDVEEKTIITGDGFTSVEPDEPEDVDEDDDDDDDGDEEDEDDDEDDDGE